MQCKMETNWLSTNIQGKIWGNRRQQTEYEVLVFVILKTWNAFPDVSSNCRRQLFFAA